MLTNLVKFLDPSIKHWDDRNRHWDDKKEALALGWKPVSATFMTSFTMSILQCSYSYATWMTGGNAKSLLSTNLSKLTIFLASQSGEDLVYIKTHLRTPNRAIQVHIDIDWITMVWWYEKEPEYRN